VNTHAQIAGIFIFLRALLVISLHRHIFRSKARLFGFTSELIVRVIFIFLRALRRHIFCSKARLFGFTSESIVYSCSNFLTTMTSYAPTKVLGGDAVFVDASAARLGTKQGHSCCSCCCDMRRAVIIVNSIMIVIMTLGTLAVVVGMEAVENADDDAVKAASAQLHSVPMAALIFINLAQIACYVFGIVGAVNFNNCYVIAAIVAYCVSLIGALIQANVGGIVLAGLFLYPHIFFYQEVKAETMTSENYPNEIQSCCCV
jgi:hypothetical protein